VDGRDVAIEYHWAEGDYDLLPWFAATLVNHQVAAIVSGGGPASLAAKSATITIPIIFSSRADRAEIGLINVIKLPGGNVTGVVSMSAGFVAKQIELIHAVAPSARLIAVLVNPSNQVELRAGALVIGADPYFDSQLDKFAALAARLNMPAIHTLREFATSGGLMSYGPDLADAYRLVGIYTGRLLNGEKPADLPVQQATKVELTVNLKTAKTFDLTVPQSVLGTADEVIE
jgi:putative ABC transport system substrate-binding protein